MKDSEIIDLVKRLEAKLVGRIKILEKETEELQKEVYCLKCQVASR